VLPLVLTVLGGCVALLPAQLGFPDPPDFVPLGMLWLAAAWGLLAARRRRRRALPITQVLAAAGMTYWMLFFSAYGEPDTAARTDTAAPAIRALRVRDDAPFELAAERGHPVLLVFFRGRW
jgi:hypothetical protein